MKDNLKNIVVTILSFESKIILNKFKPKIIGITGNVGKTTTKDFIYTVLKKTESNNIRAAEKSQNSEFGVCLTILNGKNAWNSFFAWLQLLTLGFVKEYFNKNYPEKLVLEIGADHPGDIKYLTSFVKPDVVVLTAFQKIATHREFFKNIEEHIREKKYLADALKNSGTLIYNADDEVMSNMANEVEEKRKVKKISFGKSEDADVRILESKNIYDSENIVIGTKVKLLLHDALAQGLGGGILEVELLGVLGVAQNYSLGAAVAVGLNEGMSSKEITEAIKNNFAPTNSRMRILRGINNSTIIDDSYNASPLAVENATNTLKQTFIKGKKIVVLGHMAELGDETRYAHVEQAKNIASAADVIIFSGKFNEYYLDGARQVKFPAEKIFLAKNANEVIEIIHKNNLIKEFDLLFVKGSQSARLEGVVTEFLLDKQDEKYVCRQDIEWKKR